MMAIRKHFPGAASSTLGAWPGQLRLLLAKQFRVNKYLEVRNNLIYRTFGKNQSPATAAST